MKPKVRKEKTMPREKEGFRDQLESVLEAFPGGEVLSVADVCRYTGLDHRVVVKRYPFSKGLDGKRTITRTMLARSMI